MKRVLSVLLALCLLVGALPMFASAAEASGTLATGLTWKFQNDTLTISGNGPMPDFEGSVHYNGVETWGVPWDEQNLSMSVKSLVIEEGVTHIGNYAFTTMALDAANIKIAASVTSIGNASFAGCLFTGDMVLPNTIKSLGIMAFCHVGASSVVIPDGIRELPDGLFQECYGLEKVYIPASVTKVRDNTFFDEIKDVYFAGTKAQWDQIQSLDYEGNLSNRFTKFMQGVAVHCSDGDIIIPTRIYEGDVTDTIRWELFDDGTLELTGTGETYDYGLYTTWPGLDLTGGDKPGWDDYRSQIKKVVVNEGITSIGHEIFSGCPLLESAVLPVSLKRIEVTAFSANYADSPSTIKDIYYNGTEQQWEKVKLYEAGGRDWFDNTPVAEHIKSAVIHFEDGKDPTVGGFTDVKPNAYYADAVKWAVDNGVTSGIGGGKFGPSQACKREQIVTFLWNSAGKPEPGSIADFKDMPKNETYQKSISWAVENGITYGYAGNTFRPGKTCTRAEAMTFIWRAHNCPEPSSMASFTDMPDIPDFQKAISWASENGILAGDGKGHCMPNKNCTRAEIVSFLYRAKD